MARLRSIRAEVPPPVRAASARALAFANPPAALVRLFAEDELSIAAPVLRIARLMPHEWVSMLPNMPSANRSILRHRRDLGPTVTRALESYGPSDFVLPPAALTPPMPVAPTIVAADAVIEPAMDATTEAPEDVAAARDAEPAPSAIAAPIDLAVDPPPVEIEEPLSIDWREVIAARPPVPAPTGPVAASAVAAAPKPETAAPGAGGDRAKAAGGPFVVSGRGFQIGSILAPNMPPDALPKATPPVAAPEPAAMASEPVAMAREPAAIESDPPTVAPEPSTMAMEPPAATPAAPETEAALPVEHDRPDLLVALATVALGAAPVPELARRADAVADLAPLVAPEPEAVSGETYQIADIVARIDAFQRDRDEPDGLAATEPEPVDVEAPEHFRFETDARGIVRWVAGVERAALIGMALDGLPSTGAQVDGMATGAFRRRAGFANARLVIDGSSTAAGAWRISGIPVFDRATGRFTGYRGTGRRPRADECAEPTRQRTPGTDAVRQLVHELRTPTTAIVGFAEMIEGELLGPVPGPYRGYAGNIKQQARGLLGAIDDLDTAARIDSSALDLRADQVELAPLLNAIVQDLRPLATLRRVQMALFAEPGAKVAGDERAVERLIGRLTSTMVAAGAAEETVMITAASEGIDAVTLTVDRPQALRGFKGEALLSADVDLGDDSGAPLLGTGFALRLVRNLAAELGGALVIAPDRLTLRLPAAVTLGMGQATLN